MPRAATFLIMLVAACLPAAPESRARAPVLLQIGRTDWLSSPDDAETLLRLLPAEGNRLTFYDAGHRLPARFAIDAAEWLGARLHSPPVD